MIEQVSDLDVTRGASPLPSDDSRIASGAPDPRPASLHVYVTYFGPDRAIMAQLWEQRDGGAGLVVTLTEPHLADLLARYERLRAARAAAVARLSRRARAAGRAAAEAAG